jgi:AraC family transcriptional regulator
VNLAIDYVAAHLDEPLRLADVSRAAMFSPFHFHRVFQALAGETLADFVARLRLDRALLLMSYSPRSTLTEIGQACGFSSSSSFSRCFRRRFGVPPRAFDSKAWSAAHRPRLDSAASGWSKRWHQLPVRRG